MKLSIRPAAERDQAFIENLGKRTVMDSVSALRHPVVEDVVENFGRLLRVVARREHKTLVAEVDGKPAGFLIMLDSLPDEVTGGDQAFIAYMAVEREHRGGGVGAALLQEAEDEARAMGAPYISLMVTEENDPARALYERAGYLTERRLLCKML
jgi:ribosomal protein S18 acetylase RimI-like enzyme